MSFRILIYLFAVQAIRSLFTPMLYAQSVYIESEDPDLLLDDNFFSMNPGEQTVRILRGKATFPIVRSVYDCVYSRSV